ncbi:AraC family transcriptional regulator [Aquibacillus rhizosphaerae]|uniref:AraC family transcriptional regulator n=1 Tax=Aquibacillus rhizosphaerae TaxID=3051431 RepID=A0ABT7L327_9BACI|nr:AraC family transcriptional regulator [Aquibacillus sp. LR5S19]MDL4840269.1 AraC family transcriptional regulator [Aquibacillus sp. LR5S19]
MKKGSIRHYYKLITLLIVLSTVPVIITGSLSFWKSADAIQEYSTQEKVQNVYQIQTNVDQVLKHVDLSITYFVRSTKTKQILREEMSSDTFITYHDTNSELNQLQTLDTGIEDIVLASFEKKWLINNNGLSNINDSEYSEIYSTYMSLPKSSSWILEEYGDIAINNDVKGSCSHYINLVKKLPIIGSEKTGMVSVLIPSCKLTDIMAEKVDSESFIILDESQQIIAHSNPGYIGNNIDIPESVFSDIDQDAPTGQFNKNINDTDYKITYRTSEYNNWTYLSLVKIKDLNKKSISIGWVTLIICLVLLVLSLTFAFIGSRSIYRPIRNLHELIINSFQNKEEIQQDRSNELELIETHIKQILNKNNQLETQMQGQVTQLKQFFVIRLLQGKVGQAEIPSKLTSFNYKQKWKQLTVFTLQIDSFENSQFDKTDSDLLLFAINNVIQDLIDADKSLTPVVINNTQATVLMTEFDSDDSYRHYINKQAEIIQEEVKKIFKLSVSIGISLPFEQLNLAKNAFNESKEALKYRLKLGTESIIFYASLDRNYQFFTSYPSSIKNKLFDAIKLADKGKVDQELDRFFDFLSDKKLHHNQYDIIITRFLYDLMELQQLLGIENPELDNRPIMMELYELKTFKSIQGWFKENIIQPLIEKVEERTESQYKTISDKMIHIVQKDFDKNISLDSIAAQLHYNPNYLSSIFQKEIKRPFSEYLLAYRIYKAKEWLIETDMSVKEIAMKLQYNNSQNFIRSFRKIEDTTPGKYRSQNKK